MNNSPQPTEKSGLKDDDKTESTPLPAPPAVSAPTNLICSFCDKKLSLEKYKKCPCKTTFYCMNTGCQKEHWKVHKTEHRKIQKALDSVKNEEVEEDDTKSGSKNKASDAKPSQQKNEEEKDECPICLDELSMDATKFQRFTCCGKGIHNHCAEQLDEVKSKNIRNHCPLCRTKRATTNEENIKRVQKWVKKKKAWAQLGLAHMYQNGIGTKPDVKRAFELFTLAAEQGLANAQYSLGVIYRDGIGTKPDVKRAFELYTLSAEQGLAQAQHNLGCMYANGTGVEQSFTSAREWIQKAAAQGYELAIAALKRLDEHLRKTTTTSTDDKKETSSNTSSSTTTQQEEKDECPICLDDMPKEASKFVRFSCCGKGLHHHCRNQLDQTKFKNIRDHCPLCRTKRPTTDEEIIKRIQKWVKKKKAWAQCNLGNQYLHGSCGVKKDVKRALVLFKLAAEQGDANAQFNLGCMYHNGDGTKRDVKRAFELFTLAAEQGLANAQANLGCMYAKGAGVEESSATAREWFQKAAAQGHEGAIAQLKRDEVSRRTTSTDDKKETSSNTTSSTTTQQEEKDECPICLDDMPLDCTQFTRFVCCGKGLHDHCSDQLKNTKSKNIREYCPLCRTKTPTSPEEALKQVQKWVKKKKAWAQYYLGTKYENGSDGAKKDVKRAFVLYALAAEQGNANAQCALGVMYQYGDDTKPDAKRAFELFSLSAEQGLAKAQFCLGCIYVIGEGVEESLTTAREWCAKSAAQGHEKAIAFLITLDDLTSQGDEQAIAALKRLDEDLRSTATTSTDDKKETSSNTSTQQDDNNKKSTSSTTQQKEEEDDCPICLEVLPKQASKFLRSTCCGKGLHFACRKKKNKSRSMTMKQKNTCVLCRTPANHSGSKEDIKELNFWVDRGKGWSMSMLGSRYRKGIGVIKDEKRALELYTMAAEQDYVSAMSNLGTMYYSGEGTEQDVPKGKEFFMKAATLGHVNSIIALKKIDEHESNTTPSFTPTRSACSFCGKSHAPPEIKLNPCSGCYSVYYCCKEHQRTDWKISKYGGRGHKEECKELQDASK
jgi:TPR repeat protein